MGTLVRKGIKSRLTEFKQAHPEYGTASGARKMGVTASIEFLKFSSCPADEINSYLVTGQRSIGGCADIESHTWVLVDGLHVDWSARQFDPNADFPQTWELP